MATLFAPYLQAVDGITGAPLAGAWLGFYRAGTNDEVAVYHDPEATTPHTNPVEADAAGIFPPIYLVDGNYKTVLMDADGVIIQTVQLLAVWSKGVGGGWDAQVDALSGLDAYDEQDAGFAVLVSDIGDGRAALYTLASPGDPGTWVGPAYVTGATLEGVQSSNSTVLDLIEIDQASYDALDPPAATTLYVITD